MKIALLSCMWGKVNVLRQTCHHSGIASSAQFIIHPNQFDSCDFVLIGEESLLPKALKYAKEKRIYICMENPQIWAPFGEFLSQIGNIFTPFPENLLGLPSNCNIIQSYPYVPWFYDIDFSTNAGLTHVPMHSNSELSQLLAFSMPKKTKLLSIILSAKNGGYGYAWRIQFANALKICFGDLIDIYGFGHNPLPNKKAALDNYLATIVLENCSHPFYVTEKIADAVLGWSVPIYCGSKSISHLLPGYKWTLDFGSDIDLCCLKVKKYIHQILSDSTVLESIRPIVLNRLNLFEEIPSHLSGV